MTSHDCVGKVRRLLHLKRVGHGGTLDPLATGVLPIALGPSTRLLQFLPTDKAYRATVRLGVTTTTDDLAGAALTTQIVVNLELHKVEAALKQFEGKIQQTPPQYSAIQVQGQRLYDLARQGKTVEVQPRQVEVFQIEVLDWRSQAQPEIDLKITCGPGTYIRAIARDLGAVLGTGGTLAALTRSASCGLTLDQSLTFEDLATQVQDQTFTPIAPEAVLKHLRAISLSAEMAQRWCWGQKITLDSGLLETQVVRVHHENGSFLGISELINTETGPQLSPKVVVPHNAT